MTLVTSEPIETVFRAVSKKTKKRLHWVVLSLAILSVASQYAITPKSAFSENQVVGFDIDPLYIMTSQRNVPKPPSRFLLGIFTMKNKDEKEKRSLIRATYLSSFTTYGLVGDKNRGRICMLTELLQPNGSLRLQSCELVYAFVVGQYHSSDEDKPTELFGDGPFLHNSSRDLSERKEPDVVQLRIRENMEDGKTLTWFRFASTMLPPELSISMIAKVDSDTVLFPRCLLREIHDELDYVQHNEASARTYGGYARIVWFTHDLPPYMQGGFYFLSKKLAQDVTSTTCPQESIRHHIREVQKYGPAEDREMGAYVSECAGNSSRANRVREVRVSEDCVDHGCESFKRVNRFLKRWEEGLAGEVSYSNIANISTLRNFRPKGTTVSKYCKLWERVTPDW